MGLEGSPARRESTAQPVTAGAGVEALRLANGVPVVVCPRPAAPTCVLSVWFTRGSRHETLDRNGVTHLLEHALAEAPRGPGGGLPARLEDLGCQVNAVTNREFLSVYVHAPQAAWEQAGRELVRQVLDTPVREPEIESQRRIVREELRRAQADPADIVHDLFYAALFRPGSLALPVGGTVEGLERIGVDTVAEHLDGQRVAGNVGVVAVGDLDPGSVADLLAAEGLADLPGGEPAPVDVRLPADWAPPAPGQSDYAYLMLGGVGAGCRAPDRLAFDVAAALVGGTQDSPVQGLVRRDMGLAYDGYAWHVAMSDTGIFRIGVGTAPEQVDEVADLLTGELEALASAPTREIEERVVRAARQERHRHAFDHESSVELALETGRNVVVGGAPHWSVASGPFPAGDPAPDAAAVQAALARLVSDGLTVVSTARGGVTTAGGGVTAARG